MPASVWTSEDADSTEALARQAAAALDHGGLVVLPTETVYGIASSARYQQAMTALRHYKTSPPHQPFTVHLAEPAHAEHYVPFAGGVGWVVKKLLPGPVTLRVAIEEDELDQRLSQLGLDPAHRDRVYDGAVIGLRCPDHPAARAVLDQATGPVVATGVVSEAGQPAVDAHAAAQAVGPAAEQVLDGGRCRFAQPSTILRVTPGRWAAAVEVQRSGVYDERLIRRMLSWTLLLVCSGNTCRSPMAEALASRLLAEQRGLTPEELPAAGLHIRSAGLYASPGAPATEPAVEAMRQQGLDLTTHRSQPLTPELIDQADMILTMTEAHRREVISLAPWAENKTRRLDPAGDIADPIGADTQTYRQTANHMRHCLSQHLEP